MAKKAPEQWQNRIVGYGEESPEQLLANPLNFRIHSKHQQDALLGALEEVGVVQDVIINKDTGFLVDGHLRVTLAMRTGQATIPVKYVSLSEHEEKLILATFDPISALATTDAQKLDELLHEVSTGSAAIQQMLDDMAESAGLYLDKSTRAGGDEFDTTPQEGPTRTQLGDLWQLGEHRLLIGDCTIAENVDRLMAGEPLAAVLTDVPYGISQSSNGLRGLDYGGWDKGDCLGVALAALGLCKLAPTITAFCHETQLSHLLSAMDGRTLRALVWTKPNPTVLNGEHVFLPAVELAAHGRLAGAWFGGHCVRNVWEGVAPTQREHPTQKPVALFAWLCELTCPPGGVAYDPFLGSGTTLIACERLGRKCYGCEIEPKYGDVIIRRWEAETGQEAVLLERLEQIERYQNG